MAKFLAGAVKRQAGNFPIRQTGRDKAANPATIGRFRKALLLAAVGGRAPCDGWVISVARVLRDATRRAPEFKAPANDQTPGGC
jgi:hypothetical protein